LTDFAVKPTVGGLLQPSACRSTAAARSSGERLSGRLRQTDARSIQRRISDAWGK
jgi:hypothetical protein